MHDGYQLCSRIADDARKLLPTSLQTCIRMHAHVATVWYCGVPAGGVGLIFGAQAPGPRGICHTALPLESSQGGPQLAPQLPGHVADPDQTSTNSLIIACAEDLPVPGSLPNDSDPVVPTLAVPMQRLMQVLQVSLLLLGSVHARHIITFDTLGLL